MIRGTTPRHTFALPFDTDLVATARVIYSQNGEVILTKTDTDLTMSGNTIVLDLTQEDTLSFRCGRAVEVQVRVLTLDGEALASDIVKVSIGRCLENEVIA